MTAKPDSPSLSHLSVIDLHAQLAPIAFTKGRKAIFTNWASTFSSKTAATFRPRNVQEVRMVVELARREGKELRASGSGHSPSDLVCTDGYIINVDAMNQLLAVDVEKCTYHGEAGMKLSSLHPKLREHGLAVSSLGSISDQTLAGCLSTATHGSGVTFGNLSSCVTFLDLVLPLPDAPVVRVSREQDSDLFLSALCGLGSVGVIVGVGSRCEKDFKLEEEVWTIGFAEFVERWQEIAESAEHVRCWWFPQVGQVKVSRMNRTTKAVSAPPSRISSFFTETVFAKHFHALVLTLARIFPNILPYHAHVMWALVHRPAPFSLSDLLHPIWPQPKQLGASPTRQPTRTQTLATSGLLSPPLTPPSLSPTSSSTDLKVATPLPMLTEPTYRVDLSNRIFNYDCGFPQYTYEGAVPYTRTGECLLALENWHTVELHDPKGLRSHFPVEIRWTEKDDIWLSPTYGQRATYIGAIQYRPFNLSVPYKALFTKFESILLEHSGRPHWAKSHNCSRTMLQEMYPKLGDFLEVRERVDPQGVLLNAYTRRHLLGELGEQVDMRRYKALKRVAY